MNCVLSDYFTSTRDPEDLQVFDTEGNVSFFKITPAANLSKETTFVWKPNICVPLVMPEMQIWCFTIAENLTTMNVFHCKLVIICTLDEKMIVFCLVSPDPIFSSSVT